MYGSLSTLPENETAITSGGYLLLGDILVFPSFLFFFFFCIYTLPIFLAIFRNEITTILTTPISEGGEWGRWGWSRFSF